MDPIPKHKEAGQAEPATEEIEEWDAAKLFEWIQQKGPKLLQGNSLEKFRSAEIAGFVFLMKAGDVGFFKIECNLPIGPSEALAALSRKIAEKKQDTNIEYAADINTRKRKSPPYTEKAPLLKRSRLGNSSLIFNGKLEKFQSASGAFSELLLQEGQVYFDRTRYIFKLHELGKSILFCRPRRFGKTLTISMLEHYHGVQYVGKHESLYNGLDVQKGIDQTQNKNYVKPGQYFVLKFDFSKINPNPDLTEANEALIKVLNSSIKLFYKKYATYLGGNFEALCQGIDNKEPNSSLDECALLVQSAITNNKQIEGIYVLIDEYDAFPNNYLDPAKIGSVWEETAVGGTFKSFFATIKSLRADQIVKRIFITGISPLSLSVLGSGFNIARNMSFHRDLAGLCGLTYSDLKDALREIYKFPQRYNRFLLEMTKFFNGYHFCKTETVENIYNTETCLTYLQSHVEKTIPEIWDPENSEVSEQFLKRCAASALVTREFEKALEYDEKEGYKPFRYDRIRTDFTLRDLNQDDSSAWRSLIVYFGGLTFHQTSPRTCLKIPNRVAADRIALAVLEKYHLRNSLSEALQHLIDYGKLEKVLGCYRKLMVQRDVTVNELTNTNKAAHRDSFYFSLLRNNFLVPYVEYGVSRPGKGKGHVDLVVQVPGYLVVTEWKFYRTCYLQIGNTTRDLAKADLLRGYNLSQILQLQFSPWDKHHEGTIGSFVMDKEAPQLRDYIKSHEIEQMMKKDTLQLRAHFVIVVGSRHILLWDMDQTGNLALEPCLVEVPLRHRRAE